MAVFAMRVGVHRLTDVVGVHLEAEHRLHFSAAKPVAMSSLLAFGSVVAVQLLPAFVLAAGWRDG